MRERKKERERLREKREKEMERERYVSMRVRKTHTKITIYIDEILKTSNNKEMLSKIKSFHIAFLNTKINS